jgi:hypothetical protein
MGGGGLALAAAGLVLILGAGRAAAQGTEPYVSEILASCVSDGSYSVTGTVQVVYPSSPYYDAYVQLEVYARSASDASDWVATGDTWGVSPIVYLPETSPVNQLYSIPLTDSYADPSQYDELQVQAIGGNTDMQWSGIDSSWFTCGATTSTPTPTPTATPTPSPTGQVAAASTPGAGAGAPSGPAGPVGLAVLLAGGVLILASLPRMRRRDSI